jgi:MoaA/NifB/PqqE/SkfB family radical SAM enzyme
MLYRGPLSSCNYDCTYCPFAKRQEKHAELATDRESLERFVDWIENRLSDRFSVFFTPWGEALTRRWYCDSIVRLSHLPQVVKVAAQTNLSGPLDWVAACDAQKVGLWCTFHPSQTSRSAFLARCRTLDKHGIGYSVGCVGCPDDLEAIELLRRELPENIYLWINAYKSSGVPYDETTRSRMLAIDPLFELNTHYHASFGRSCRTGSSVVSVDGDGDIRRCHFIHDVIGNLYERDFQRCLIERPCTNRSCGCHIGYAHLDHLGLRSVFGAGLLERVPAEPVWRRRPTQTGL